MHFWKGAKIGDIKSHGCDGNILVANDNEDKANAFGDYFAGVNQKTNFVLLTYY